MLTSDQIALNIINQVKLLDPAFSAEVGTPERKIIEATAELIASQQVDFTVLNTQTDVSTLSGGRLDAYLSIYNFGRQQATPSYGTVTFKRNTQSVTQIVIPRGTQVQANINNSTFPSLIFVTTDTVVLETNSLSVDATVQCTVAGTVGNIDANTVVGFGGLANIPGISSVSNSNAFTGGADQETDTAYVTRFQNSFLRNINGTTDMFLALAVAQNGITKANVVGPVSRYQEYVQIPTADDKAQHTTYDTTGVHATAVLTSDNTEPVDGDTVTLHDKTYRFKNTPIAIGDIKRTGSTADADLANLVKAVNQSGLGDGTDYFAGTLAPTDVYASAVGVPGAHQITFFGDYTTAANAWASTETSIHLSFGGVTFSGGANAIWPHKRTTAESTIPYSKYTWPTNHYVTDSTLDPATAVFFRESVDFIFNAPPIDATVAPNATTTTPTTSPNITLLQGAWSSGNTLLTSGQVLLLEHAYISTHSRNDYTFGVLNCIDVFVNGQAVQDSSSIEVVPDSSHNLQNTDSTKWTYQHLTSTVVVNFQRKLDAVASAVGSRILPLYWQPVIDLPDQLQIGSNTFYKANFWNVSDSTYYNQYDGVTYSFPAHYIFVEEVNSLYGTVRSRSGIEFFQAGNNYLVGQLPTDTGQSYTGSHVESLVGTQFTVQDYFYDQNIPNLQAIMEKNKQVTTDVLVHATRVRYFRPIVTIMYSFGVTQSVVNASIIASLTNFFENQYYGSAIQLSDILQVIHNVPGVDNVRWTNDTPNGNKVEEVALNGNSLNPQVFKTADFFIQDSELADSPTANQITIEVRAQNTFST